MSSLVIVESPTKARTIGQFLGSDFIVKSSFGHIRDLPKKELGIDIEHDFQPKYVIPRKVSKTVTELKKLAAKADKVILATDEDREGEAIAWHISQALGLAITNNQEINSKQNPKSKTQSKNVKQNQAVARIVFHEITRQAIENALMHPRGIDMNLVDAQQARRILDRLVGYKLSPFLWKKLARGLSAGRVQSPAVRLIVEREREIQNFKNQEYWTITVLLEKKNSKDSNLFEANLFAINSEALDKFAITNEKDANLIKEKIEQAKFLVQKIEKKEVRRFPLPPFITSTLQQEAWKRLHMPSKFAMGVAQRLYESGFITYMRTDSVNLSQESLVAAQSWLTKNLGNEYTLSQPRLFKKKSKLAQEAHEAIRPADPAVTPEAVGAKLEKAEARLYDLIWRRFVASQMPEAIFDSTAIFVDAAVDKNYNFKASGLIKKFDGFTKIWNVKTEEKILPQVSEGEELDAREIKPQQHFTEPPPRYSEATLVKTLEELGIGRPSTYAPIMSTIKDRNYVDKNERRLFYPTEIGFLVNDLLVEHFPAIVDYQFTAHMEEDLDEIAEGEKEWLAVLRAFYGPFEENLKAKYDEVQRAAFEEKTDQVCEKCGKPMIIKFGRYGKFMACSGFPDCKNIKSLPKEPPKSLGIKCPKCGEGDVIERKTKKRGKLFYGCSRWPACDYASWEKPVAIDSNPEEIL